MVAKAATGRRKTQGLDRNPETEDGGHREARRKKTKVAKASKAEAISRI